MFRALATATGWSDPVKSAKTERDPGNLVKTAVLFCRQSLNIC